MKKVSLLLLIVTSAILQVFSFSHSNFNIGGEFRLQKKVAGKKAELSGDVLPLLLKFKSGNIDDSLVALGVEVLYQRDDLAIVTVPIENWNKIGDSSSIICVEVMNPMSVHMDLAAPASNIDKIRNMENLSQPYTGKGVLAAFTDIGFDPNHINFRDNNGNSRVARVVNVTAKPYIFQEAVTPEEIAEWTTDNSAETHATHVAGIMAGYCPQTVYTGVATGATVMATTSDLYNESILITLEEIVKYSKEQGMPVVINMSLGDVLGPHDGSSLFCQYLDKIGEKDAIICLSAGNDAHNNMSIDKNMTAEDNSFATVLIGPDWTGFHLDGAIDIWSDDDTPFDIEMMIVDYATKTVLKTYPLTSDELYLYSSEIDEGYDEFFSSFYSGEVLLQKGVSPLNGRYNAVFLMACDTRNTVTSTGWADQFLAFRVTSPEGSRIVAYAGNGFRLTQNGMPGFVSGNGANSISDCATGKYSISVGAHKTRTSVPQVDGSEKKLGGTDGQVAYFSSYGYLPDGTKLPDVSASGYPVISSLSHYYTDTHNMEYACVKVTAGGIDYYWADFQGTSMSTPIVAGTVALWLEADPTLDVLDVKRIIAETSVVPAVSPEDVKWARCGMLDSYAGLKRVIELSGVADVKEQPALKVDRVGQVITISSLTSESFAYGIYSVSGIHILSGNSTDTASIDISSLSAGIYLLKLQQNRCEPKVIKFVK